MTENTDDRSAYFCSVNWGKRSIALNLESTDGQDVVRKLAAKSDVVIASYKPGDAKKLGVDFDSLKALQPSIIYGEVTGYGPNNKRVGYDAIVQAEAGFMYMNGEPGGPSLKMPVALIDVLAAHQLKEGLLLALLNKERTREGALVQVSLIDAAISSLVNQATNWLMCGIVPGKQGSAHPNIAPYGDTFETSDGKEIILAVGSDRQFLDLCRVLHLPGLVNNPLYITNKARVSNRSTLHEILADRITSMSSVGLLQSLHLSNIPAGLIQTLKEVFASREGTNLTFRLDDVAGVRSLVSRSSFLLNETTLLPPPHFGEHTIAIIEEMK
jgi:crotonobetainyl-CoA:carnitine CoA-transferase CaiB-like acyl-CoA transferase